MPATAATALDAFEADLLSGGVATRVLEAWSGGPVHAAVERGTIVTASIQTRVRLGVGPDAPLGFRRVRLMRGDVVLSQADNWFVPDRLSADMRIALEQTDIPFGVVIAPLDPHRETRMCERLNGDPVLRISALVLAADGTPLAEVVEDYAGAVLGF
ncbi:MAG: hypothetical protein V4537_15075 [Pseudomonadota bacterium]